MVIIYSMIDFLKTISDEQRLRIINLVDLKKLCVCDLESTLKIKQSTLSSHLSKLRKVNVIDFEKDGKWIYYFLNDNLDIDFKKIISIILNNFRKTDIAKNDINNLEKLNSGCKQKKNIIVICTSNSCRSQITEAIIRNYSDSKVFSAGLNPKPTVNENIKKFLAKKFPDLKFFPKHIDNFKDDYFDYAIFVCKDAYNSSKYSVNAKNILFWDIEDIDNDNVTESEINNVYNKLLNKVKKELLK
jgi:DNA-binding transcriptional ArsR family regulator/protein-tyrosine-phosphatase